MTDTPHRTVYMQAFSHVATALLYLAVAYRYDHPGFETSRAIRDRLQEFRDLYTPPTDQTRDTVEAGYRDGKLAVSDALAQAHLDARHIARCTGRDIYAVTRFFDALEDALYSADYTQD